VRSWLTLAALAALVIALGLWVYYRPASVQSETYALSALQSKDVKRSRVERSGAKDSAAGSTESSAGTAMGTIVLERRNDQWRMSAPVTARAEAFQVERLLSILEARSAVRYPAGDLARYGLDKPYAKVTLEDQSFVYGAINRTTREQYVLTHDDVYLVALAYTTALPRDADSLLARQLFGTDEIPIAFELADFSLSLKEGTWTASGLPRDTSADERNAWVDAWRHASAIRATRSDAAAPAANVKVGLRDGRTITIGVLKRDPEVVLLRRDEGIEYHFFGDTGKRLLMPPGALPSAATK